MTTHGMTQTNLHKVWLQMRNRCRCKTNKAYKNYGGRGITVCARWANSVENFLEDMGERPEGKWLERRDNNLGYFPENCYWIQKEKQQRNKRTNRLITYKGETKCLAAWAEDLVIEYNTLRARLKRHPPEIAFNM